MFFSEQNWFPSPEEIGDEWNRNQKIDPPGMCHTEDCIALFCWRYEPDLLREKQARTQLVKNRHFTKYAGAGVVSVIAFYNNNGLPPSTGLLKEGI